MNEELEKRLTDLESKIDDIRNVELPVSLQRLEELLERQNKKLEQISAQLRTISRVDLEIVQNAVDKTYRAVEELKGLRGSTEPDVPQRKG